MTGLLRALFGPGKARRALFRGVLAVAVLIGSELHFEAGDRWVDGVGLAAQVAISVALVGVGAWVGRSFAACVAFQQIHTHAVMWCLAALMAPQQAGVVMVNLPTGRPDCTFDATLRLEVCPFTRYPDGYPWDLGGPLYFREIHLAEGVAVWARRRLDPPPPLVLPDAATLDALVRSADLSALTAAELENIHLRARIEGWPADRGPIAAQRSGEADVLIAWSPDEVSISERPNTDRLVTWVRTDGVWVAQPF